MLVSWRVSWDSQSQCSLSRCHAQSQFFSNVAEEVTDVTDVTELWTTGIFETTTYHQEFQVPKMEVLNLIRPFWGWVFPYISLTYSLYR